MYGRVTISRIGIGDSMLEPSLELMRASFVPDELRDESEVRFLMENSPLFSFNVILADGERVGFITTWNFGKFIFGEHFATEPSVRGQGIGGKAMAELARMSSLPMILEVEPADLSDEARRRQAFYERAGFVAWKTPYVQPPFGPGKRAVRLVLMARGMEENEETVRIAKEMLYKQVYKGKKMPREYAKLLG